ncbi:DNA polymerase III subunit gamma and tau [Luteimicrobium sp. DT211]|uniref:DNA polymerase III subunit gamma and tau n=1 Tax=Luteimicrobium sp. DT211 TaxID=3393412 RepID=UPI003CF280F9
MSTALYRRYRPETFAEVIGQEHVTGPLMQALRTGRVNHAYLFSGPRGCGKTTSARILARTLNCHRNTPETPIDTPCGECPSCVDLARGGSGSLDVVEIDAASHGGVDDARELRERATFAPSRDRYKVFIIDEAHMVSSAGFNALLKIVEEPPEHVRFIFATTEPDKVIGTIRSRTHHYPFRLVPPDVLIPYLDELCRAEGVEVGSGVLPLVVRAGGGSVRDTLSVLDQLIAGADEAPGSGEGGQRRRVLDYEQAVALLGYTHATLLDDVVGALAARDGASMFRVVERVIESGHEPRRFVEDVLERLRDLVVLAVADGEAVAALGDLPSDQLERMRAQSTALGLGELSRAADLANAALTEMTGATSPRLHLELLCARLLLPGADDGAAGFGARLDRLERGWVGTAGGSQAAAPAPAQPAPPRRAAVEDLRPVVVRDPEPESVPADEPESDVPAAELSDEPESATPSDEPSDESGAELPGAELTAAELPAAVPSAEADVRTTDSAATPVAPAEAAPTPAGSNVAHVEGELVRRRWDEVLQTLFRMNKGAWTLVKQDASVASLDGNVLTLSFSSPGLQRAFQSGKSEAVEKAVYETLGFPVKVSAVVGGVPAPVARPRAEHRQASQDDDGGTDAPGDRAVAPDGAPAAAATAAPSAVVPDAAVPAATTAGVSRTPGGPPPGEAGGSAPPTTPSPRTDAAAAADAAWLAGSPRSTTLAAGPGPTPSSTGVGTPAAGPRVDAAPAPAPASDGAGARAARPPASGPAGPDERASYDGIPVAEPPDDAPFPDDGGSWAPRAAAAGGARLAPGTQPAGPVAPVAEPPVARAPATTPPAAPAAVSAGIAAARSAANAPRARVAVAPAPARTSTPPDDDGPPWDDEPSGRSGGGPGRAGDGGPGGSAPPNLVGAALVAQLLGGTVIDEIVEQRQ